MTHRTGGAGASRLLLAGAGHAHLAVLRDFAARPPAGVACTLVAPDAKVLYSGLVPSVIAGQAPIDLATIDVEPLARAAGVELLVDRVTSVDPDRRCARTSEGRDLAWDALSLDVGSTSRDAPGLVGDPRVVPVRPLSGLVLRVEEFMRAVAASEARPEVAVVGAGAAGIELAFALRARLRRVHEPRVVLLERGDAVLPAGSSRGRRLVERELAGAGIETITGCSEIAFRAARLHAAGKPVAEPGLVLVATGGVPPPFLAATSLGVDAGGHLLVDRFLRSTSHPAVSGAGDCIAVVGRPGLSRSGVAAVRQGPVLARNLRAAVDPAHAGPSAWRPRSAELALLSTGDGRAIALRGRFAASGRAFGRLKRWIDLSYVDRHRTPAGVPPRDSADLTTSQAER